MLTPEQALEGIYDRFGRHAGYRALHAKGTLTKGSFVATPAAAELTRAPHMQGDAVPVTARLSNGAGHPRSRDYEPDVRGLAVSFHLSDGERTDISAQTAPHFPNRSPDEFIAFLRASKPAPASLARFPFFVLTHPHILRGLPGNIAALRPPPSYASCRYYAIHAFKWSDANGGERFVRYRWLPEVEEPRLSPRTAKKLGRDYLQVDLAERLGRGPVRFRLEVQIAAEGDEVDDPTSEWPDDRERVIVGTLELSELDEAPDEREPLVFDPMRVVDGIEPSDDPVLRFRPRAYSVSVDRRAAAAD